MSILLVLIIIAVVTSVVVVSYNNTKSTPSAQSPPETCIVSSLKTGFTDRIITIIVNTSNFVLKTAPSHGTVAVSSETTLLYTPIADFIGTDSFTYSTESGCKIQNIVVCDITLVQKGAKLIGVGGSGATSARGTSAAMSADGLTLAVGGPGNDTNNGATWIFTRTNVANEFVQQGGVPFIGTGGTGVVAEQGTSVALSNNGLILAVGGTGVLARQGTSVALSSDGLVLAVGGPNDNTANGGTWIFNRTVITDPFVQQGAAPLIGTGGTGTASLQGTSIDMSADGLNLVVGGPGDNTNVGATWLFRRTAITNTFVQVGATPFIGAAPTGASSQGTSVALSADGLQLAVGGPDDDSNAGAIWIFTRAAPTDPFTPQGAKFLGTGATTAANQGKSLDLSADGLILAVGGPADDTNVGATWVFGRGTTSDEFSQEGDSIIGSNDVGAAQQGTNVALSSNGLSLAVGGAADNFGAGAIWAWGVAPCVV